jgi:hypothetical protein
MNVEESARRIKRSGKWLVFITATTILLLSIAGVIAGGSILDIEFAGFFPFVFRLLAPATYCLLVAGVLIWIAGWVVEGFAKKEQ